MNVLSICKAHTLTYHALSREKEKKDKEIQSKIHEDKMRRERRQNEDIIDSEHQKADSGLGTF
jgi:hypothetical protein